MNKKQLVLITAAFVTTPQILWAQEQDQSSFDFSANTAIVSDYVFRGISQSDENFAIQGGFDVSHDSGQ